MDVFRKAMSIVYNGLAGQTKQEWSNDKSKVRVMLVGDDILDNFVSTTTPDICQTLNNFSNISCFNCAIKGNTMDAILCNKPPSSLTRLNRPYEYPQNIDGQFDVLNWSNRTHWIVLGVGYNEKKQGVTPLDIYERQLTSILDQILKKNKNCIVVSVSADRWSEFKNMVEKTCTSRNVSFLVDSPSLGQDIYNMIHSSSSSTPLNLVIEPPVDSLEECKITTPVFVESKVEETPVISQNSRTPVPVISQNSRVSTPVPLAESKVEVPTISESNLNVPVISETNLNVPVISQNSRVSTPVRNVLQDSTGSTESDIEESRASTPVRNVLQDSTGSTESDIEESRASTPVISQNSRVSTPVRKVTQNSTRSTEPVEVETALATSMEPALEVDDGLDQWEKSVSNNSSDADI